MKKFLLSMGIVLSFTANTARALPSNAQLTLGTDQEFETLNPVILQMAVSTYMYNFVGYPLVSINADWKWDCWLCTKYPTLENKLARIVTENGQKKLLVDWEIKPTMMWGDGKPVTGADVKFSWEVGKSPNVSVGEKDLYERIESITVDAKNPRKFTMKYGQPRYDYAMIGTFYVIPEHIERPIFERTKNTPGAYEKQTAYTTDPTNPGLYSGPYIVKEIKLGSHSVFVPNPHFGGHKPAIQKIVFKLIPNTQTLEANLLSGTIDMICELGQTFDQAIALEKRVNIDPALKSNYKVLFRKGTIYEHIDLNLRNPVLQDVRLRRALMYSLDREKMVKALFEGKQEVALHDLHPLDPYYSEDVPKYAFDLKKAGDLLDEAGWKMGKSGIREKDGKKLSLQLMTTAQNKTREQVQVFVQNEWKKAGIEIRIKNEPARVFFGETVRKGIYPDMAMFAWVSSPDNPPRVNLHSSEIPVAPSFKGQNSGAWKNKKVDDVFDKVMTSFSLEERKKLMHTFLWEYASEVPVVPLYYRVETATVPANLKNFRITGHQFYSSNSAENWTLQ
jgi:peptide/nickel transport system substrate-binding protein